MNINIDIQYDTDFESGIPMPLSFAKIKEIREAVNAPAWATIQFEQAPYGWEIHIHWNTNRSN